MLWDFLCELNNYEFFDLEILWKIGFGELFFFLFMYNVVDELGEMFLEEDLDDVCEVMMLVDIY